MIFRSVPHVCNHMFCYHIMVANSYIHFWHLFVREVWEYPAHVRETTKLQLWGVGHGGEANCDTGGGGVRVQRVLTRTNNSTPVATVNKRGTTHAKLVFQHSASRDRRTIRSGSSSKSNCPTCVPSSLASTQYT
jgi:hypothetical protein